MFNLSGSEIVFLLLIALIVLGPEKLPEAVRKFGKTYAEFKKMTSGFQSELKSALDEPMREMRETAEAFKKAANFDFNDDPETTVADEPAAAAPPISTVTPVTRDTPDIPDTPDTPDTPVDESPIADSDRPPGPTFTSAAPRQPDTVDAIDAVEKPASE